MGFRYTPDPREVNRASRVDLVHSHFSQSAGPSPTPANSLARKARPCSTAVTTFPTVGDEHYIAVNKATALFDLESHQFSYTCSERKIFST